MISPQARSLANTLNVVRRRLAQLQGERAHTKEDLAHFKVRWSWSTSAAADECMNLRPGLCPWQAAEQLRRWHMPCCHCTALVQARSHPSSLPCCPPQKVLDDIDARWRDEEGTFAGAQLSG